MAQDRESYLAGFATTSNLEAGRRYGIPTRGTVAHAFMLLHDSEEQAFRAQVDKTLAKAAKDDMRETEMIGKMLHDDLAELVYRKLKRRPMVLPVVVEV